MAYHQAGHTTKKFTVIFVEGTTTIFTTEHQMRKHLPKKYEKVDFFFTFNIYIYKHILKCQKHHKSFQLEAIYIYKHFLMSKTI